LFVDYGQAAAASEAGASAAVASHFRVPHQTLMCRGRSFGSGEIRGRNAFLAHLALMTLPGETGIVVLGIHAGTGYRDCSADFVDLIQRSYDFHAAGQIVLSTPLLELTKAGVVGLAMSLRVPLDLTYSCEAANEPCGHCLSCGDREEFVARS
jgi:7-cyano-7-deazaguanine synthase